MTNEEFQKMVLEELKGLKEGQNELNSKVDRLEIGQQELIKQVNAITEQTADLSEFKTESNEKLDIIIEENEILQGIVGTHEVSIRRIQRKVV